eukprot:4334380-Pleurochrysis_carterae.AAC.1
MRSSHSVPMLITAQGYHIWPFSRPLSPQIHPPSFPPSASASLALPLNRWPNGRLCPSPSLRPETSSSLSCHSCTYLDVSPEACASISRGQLASSCNASPRVIMECISSRHHEMHLLASS